MAVGAGFQSVQELLAPALALNTPGATEPHVLIALPSYSVGESLLSHYANRIAPLEHRYLVACLVLGRIPGCHLVFVTCRDPGGEAVDHYLGLLPPNRREDARRRLHLLVVEDPSHRAVAVKLLDRPDLVAALRDLVAGRPAFIEPWNVTDAEVAVAVAVGAPINGTDPSLRGLATKSAGRRLFAEVGVPTPYGTEDVRSVEDVLAAVGRIRRERPGAPGVVVKHDDSGAGDGNVTIDLTDLPPEETSAASVLRQRVELLPEWYLRDLRGGGGVVEERIAGTSFSSPSAQVDVRPDGEVVVLSTHEQVLGGPGNQVYLGCRFPADPAYAAELARHAAAVGRRLARAGVRGRLSVDFVAVRQGPRWQVLALEVNLRKGGTTHPYAILRNLVPGRYDAGTGEFREPGGPPKFYSSTDNLVSDSWRGLPPANVLAAVAAAGLTFDRRSRTGVVLHMLSCLAVDGRLGVTAVADSPVAAVELQDRTRVAVEELAGSRVTGRAAGRPGGGR